jgi:hypothetical protein
MCIGRIEMAFRTEKQYKEACEELMNQIEEGIIPRHSVSDAINCLIIEMWKSDWYKQKNIKEIRKAGEL